MLLFLLLDCAVEAFRELNELEHDFTILIDELFHQGFTISDKLFRRPLPHQRLSGSLTDGGSIARVFYLINERDEESSIKIHPSVEVDLETNLAIFPREYSHCLNDISDKIGFVKFQVLGDTCFCPSCISPNLLDSGKKSVKNIKFVVESVSNVNGFILPEQIKNRFFIKNSFDFKENNYLSTIKPYIAILFDKPIHSIKFFNCFEKTTKATNAIGCDVYLDNVLKISFSIDLSYNIKLQWMTNISQAWIDRMRSWPSSDELKNEMNYTYIIAKPSFKEKANLNTTEFRYSFAHVERKIFSLQSPNQKLIFLIFKSIFYQWIIPIDHDRISSYIAKTIMLWICEEKPPNDVFWEGNNNSILKAVRSLFENLLDACRKSFLSYYFLPEMNVFANLPDNVIKRMEFKVMAILSNLEFHIPKNAISAKAFLMDILRISRRGSGFMTEILKGGSTLPGHQWFYLHQILEKFFL